MVVAILCRFYHHRNLIHCIRLLIQKEIDVDMTDKDDHIILGLLRQQYSGEDLMDIARLLVRKMNNMNSARSSVFVLLDRGLHHDAEFREGILDLIRSGFEDQLTRVS